MMDSAVDASRYSGTTLCALLNGPLTPTSDDARSTAERNNAIVIAEAKAEQNAQGVWS